MDLKYGQLIANLLTLFIHLGIDSLLKHSAGIAFGQGKKNNIYSKYRFKIHTFS